jgi:molybdenum cofactor cytidylyltransferase
MALIPAAGKSVRMGEPKLALPLGRRCVLECVATAFVEAGVRDILVVLGPHVAFLRERAELAGANVLVLENETPDMRTTMLHGLAEMEERFAPAGGDFWFLATGDHPTLEPDIIRILLAARDARPDRSLFVPTHAGRRGHPALVGWRHVANLRASSADQGPNAYFRQHAFEVPVPSADILVDLDTPADYETLRRRLGLSEARGSSC